MESFFTFLEKRVDDCSSLLCIGLDPHGKDLRRPTADSARDFCLTLVKQTARYAAAFKPNAAFFEVLGAEGWTALKDVIEAIKDESRRQGSLIPTILDAKRGDIASTAEAYAKSAFENLGADCITLNPYLGRDSIEPFLHTPEKGVFLLCKTSNAGSIDLQDLPVLPAGSDSPMPMYSYVARLARQWNERNNIGLVVGATHPQIMSNIRAAVPDMWFLTYVSALAQSRQRIWLYGPAQPATDRTSSRRPTTPRRRGSTCVGPAACGDRFAKPSTRRPWRGTNSHKT